MAVANKNYGRILYLTDKYGVSQGYEPAFTSLVSKARVPRGAIIVTSIYNDLGPKPLLKYMNEKTPRYNPDYTKQIKAAVDRKIRATKPALVVCSDPVALGLFMGWDRHSATIDKTRGGVYQYEGLTVVIVPPVTAIHRGVEERHSKDDDGEDVPYEPYKVKNGAWILARDWEKVGRYYQGKQRRLPPFVYSICRTVEDCFAARDWLLECVLISSDVETACFPAQITCVGYTGLHKNGTVRSFVIPFADEYSDGGVFWESQSDHEIAYSVMVEINESSILKTFQNGNYDQSYFIRDRAPANNWLLDSMYMWYSRFSELPKTLDFISSILIDIYQYWKDDIKGAKEMDEVKGNLERYWRYNALDTYYTLFNTLYLLQLMSIQPSMKFNYNDTFMRCLSALNMSMRGVKADFKKLKEHRDRLQSEVDAKLERLRYMIATPDFNVNSTDHKRELLYTVLGCRKRNERGRPLGKDSKEAPSTGAIVLKTAKTEHPLVGHIIGAMQEVMEADKQMGLITGREDSEGKVKGGIKFFTDRLRTAYSGVGTTSTRLSSKSSNFWDGSNVQNIRGSMRDFAVADPECILVDVDYSQSDDVFVGYESNDPHKIEVIESGLDGHAIHGELFFARPYDWIVAGKKAGDPQVVHPTRGVRQLSKRVVHGSNFMMAALTLFFTMGREAVVAAAEYAGHADASRWPQEQLVMFCGELDRKYRNKYPRLKMNGWYKDLTLELSKTGTLTNAFGITRTFLGDPKDSGTLREASGFMGQSDTAGNMNRVQNEIDHGYIPKNFRDGANPCANATPRKMTRESHGFSFLLQTHDSFTVQLDLNHKRWKEAFLNLLHVMERNVTINGHVFRVKTEAEFGRRWGKNMLAWNGDPDSLDDLAARALAQP